jgi:Fur family ferric uptake transcriptional regulator
MAMLRAAGLRRTTKRAAILTALADAQGHLHIGELVARLREAGAPHDYSTVWRTVLTLSDPGLAHVPYDDGVPAYGLSDRPHHHAVCTDCGTVVEIPASAMDHVVSAAQQATGLALADGGVHLSGRRPGCQAPHSPEHVSARAATARMHSSNCEIQAYANNLQ